MKYSQTKLNRAAADLRAMAQDGVSQDIREPVELDKHTAEMLMIVLDRLSKLEMLVNQRPDKPMITKLEDAR